MINNLTVLWDEGWNTDEIVTQVRWKETVCGTVLDGVDRIIYPDSNYMYLLDIYISSEQIDKHVGYVGITLNCLYECDLN